MGICGGWLRPNAEEYTQSQSLLFLSLFVSKRCVPLRTQIFNAAVKFSSDGWLYIYIYLKPTIATELDCCIENL